MTNVLMKEAYEQRRAELTEHHEAAKAEFRRVALKRERGSAEPAEVDEARSAVAGFEQRLAALDDAWQEAQIEADLVKHLRGAGKFIQAYDEAGEEVRALLAPFSRDIKGLEHENRFGTCSGLYANAIARPKSSWVY